MKKIIDMEFCVQLTEDNEHIVKPWFEQTLKRSVNGGIGTYWHYPEITRHVCTAGYPKCGRPVISTDKFLQIINPVIEVW